MNIEHTPEPWDVVIHSMSGIQIRSDFERIALIASCGGEGNANARRIVACINACAGIPTETIEQLALIWFICKNINTGKEYEFTDYNTALACYKDMVNRSGSSSILFYAMFDLTQGVSND